MESSAPKVVAISRAGRLIHRAELMQWVEDHYDQMDLPGYEGIYLRRRQIRDPSASDFQRGSRNDGLDPARVVDR